MPVYDLAIPEQKTVSNLRNEINTKVHQNTKGSISQTRCQHFGVSQVRPYVSLNTHYGFILL